ncbi:MAG: DUF4364 family protein [Clostridiales bacterium]|nr:DUF4364 family protein [Clostridiales bacterium]
MEFDAFRAGVEPGGLINRTEIRLLVCYLLKSIRQPLSGQLLQELFHYEGLANYFEVGQAIQDLLEQGNIRLSPDEPDAYELTDSGRSVVVILERDLPATVREKAVKSAVRLLTRIRREAENKVEITKAERGYVVSCSVMDRGVELMKVRLMVADEIQAKTVREIFLDDPSAIYTGVVELMTHDHIPYSPN